MGYTDFLVGLNRSTPSNLPEAIAELEEASLIFLNRWINGENQRAGEVSKKAMTLLDFIANELLRAEVDRKGAGTYAGTPFEAVMTSPCGKGVTGVSQADQMCMVQAGPGNGSLPTHLGRAHLRPVPSLCLQQLLNKVKHRNPNLMNFRISAGKHIFVICPDKTGGGAEGIYEFDVAEFCSQCRVAATSLK